jgi:hypothetical protein
MDSMFIGKSANQVTYKWTYENTKWWGKKVAAVNNWTPVHGDKLHFKFDGTPGIMVHSSERDKPGVEFADYWGPVKFFNQKEQEQLFWMEFEPEDREYNKAELAAQVHGSGIRGRIYWLWWLKHNLTKDMFSFVRKVGNGFFLAGYASGNASERDEIEKGMTSQAGEHVIYVPISNNSTKISDVLTHLPVNLSGSEFMVSLGQQIDAKIRDAILGTGNANKAMPTGIGGSQAEQAGMTDDERVKYDAEMSEPAIQRLVNVLNRHTFPGFPPPTFSYLCDKRNPAEFMESIDRAMQWGLTVKESQVRDNLSLETPEKNEPTLSMVQSQQATAINAVPGGTPMVGSSGPQQ